ncbi:MAG: phage tail protein [Eubacteriales bacterium]|nr:phage tail protein [Eubacteriales bacterium]
MLANGATLGYKTASTGAYTNLEGLKEIPDMGVDKERIDNTVLTAKNKQYEYGIGDLEELVYKFKYDNTSSTSPYRVMRGYSENNTPLYFQEKLVDGTTTEFEGQVSVKRTGGTVNGVIEFELKIAVSSDLKYTDPA